MIIRHMIRRHGRARIVSTSRSVKQCFASESSRDSRSQRPSTGDHVSETVAQGHPDQPTGILEASTLPPTAETRRVAAALQDLMQKTSSIEADLHAHIAGSSNASIPVEKSKADDDLPPSSYAGLEGYKEFVKGRESDRKRKQIGSHLTDVYNPWDIVKSPPRAEELTLAMLLANQTHLGHHTSLWNPANSSYIFGVREGIHIISLEITLSYLRRAAKVVQEVARRGGIILFIGTRKGQQDIIVPTARRAEGYHIFDRWVPGTLTNGQQILADCAVKVVNSTDQKLARYDSVLPESNHPVLRPDLVVCMNPVENEVCLHECGLYNVPTVGVIDTDANPSWVTYPIPANDDSWRSIALIAGVLGRAAQAGQMQRKDAARNGQITYDTQRVQNFLQDVEELSALEIQESSSSSGSERETGS